MTARNISQDEYVALQQPVRAPSADELFAYERDLLVEKRLAKPDMFDRFAKRLPSGLFILVPPQPVPSGKLDWSELMARVELTGKRGQNDLDPKHLTDEIEVPDVSTMLTGVEDGRSLLNIRPMDSRAGLKREGRTAYTVWRGFVHIVLFTEVLRHHVLDIVGSLDRAERVPCFFLYGGAPTLTYHWGAMPIRWGAPSCGSVER